MIKNVSTFVKEQCDTIIGYLKVNPIKRLTRMYRAFLSKKREKSFNSSRFTLKRKSMRRMGWRTKVNFFRDKMVGVKKISRTNSTEECNKIIETPIIESKSEILEKSSIFKLNQKCFDQIFDWLSISDLHALGETCKEMHEIAGKYFQENYPAASIRCDNDGIYSTSGGQVNGFSPYIRKVSAFGSGVNRLRNISENCDSIKRLHLDISLSSAKIKCIRPVLGDVEVLEIENCTFNDRLFKRFLKYCPNLKELYVRDIHQKSENGWMLKNYAQLEHLELTPWEELEIDELKEFFELNPNIRSFSTSAKCLWVNRDSIIDAKFHLDDLAIEIDSFTELESICSLLDALYTQQFYKRLYLYIASATQQTVDQIASLHALEKLYISSTAGDIDLTSLNRLKEIGFHMGTTIKDLDSLAQALTNLEGIYFYYASSDHILPFIQHSTQLKRIKIRNLENGTHFDGNTIYLTAFEKERKKLADAEKTIIYLSEDIFLNTKWTTDSTDFDLIEIERGDSYEWKHHFRHYLH